MSQACSEERAEPQDIGHFIRGHESRFGQRTNRAEVSYANLRYVYLRNSFPGRAAPSWMRRRSPAVSIQRSVAAERCVMKARNALTTTESSARQTHAEPPSSHHLKNLDSLATVIPCRRGQE